jgi:hypothetical protein
VIAENKYINMNKEQKKIVDYIIKGIFYIIFSPIIILYGITYGINASLKYLFEKALNPLYHKVCKIVRGPIPNSTVCILDEKSKICANGWEWELVNGWQPGWHRVNENLLTIKEAKALGKEYEDKGYKVDLHLSEF